ncbi:hypothetical protein CGCFRS4_v008570 [Colletotrichum fructicola]|nr:hypothetical protein CGCFRS4_v008570 [Colletotrichum fructicola]
MKLRLDPQLWNTLEGYRISWKVMRTLSALTQWKLLEEDSHVFKDEKGTTLSQNGSSFPPAWNARSSRLDQWHRPCPRPLHIDRDNYLYTILLYFYFNN